MRAAAQLVTWLGSGPAELTGWAGGKGASLSRLARAGLPVPDGFVVGAGALTAALDAAGRRAELTRWLKGVTEDPGAPPTAMREMVLGLELPSGLPEEVERHCRELGPNVPVAVRSSACAEDSELASFAGLHETYLNVRGVDQVLHKVRECWASFFSERALFYRSRKGSLEDLTIAVVIQRQLEPDKAGVMFTIDPVRRRRDQMVIEAAWGLGEAVVSGRVTPDHYLLARDGRVKRAQVSIKRVAVQPLPGGGTEERELEAEQAAARVLSDAELAELVELGANLQAYFGAPQDIEWAFQRGRLYLLQSRPVTT